MSEPFVGEVSMFAGNFAPRGWAFCNGQLLPISQNTALFSLLGTTFGGDGRTTFGLPDLQGRAPMHPGRGPGLTDRRLGQTGGAETVTLGAGQTSPHTHSLRSSADDNDQSSPANNVAGVAEEPSYRATHDADMASDIIQSVGSGQAHDNLQPSLTIQFIIALVGLYPSRS